MLGSWVIFKWYHQLISTHGAKSHGVRYIYDLVSNVALPSECKLVVGFAILIPINMINMKM